MSFFSGLFASARALRVSDEGVTPVPEELRVHHANQRFARAWTIARGTAADAHLLTKLALETPGLTVVRVRPDLAATPHRGDLSDGATLVAARVVVSSDAAEHLARLEVAVKHKHELRVAFKNTKSAESALGALVVEIELANAGLVHEVRASGGGDVVVVDQGSGPETAVLSRNEDASVSLVALDPGSRLFVLNGARVSVQGLRVASVSGGSVFVSSTAALEGRDHVMCMVLGEGRVAVRAPRVETRALTIAVVGARGHAQLVAPELGVAATKAEIAVVGGGAVLVQTSAERERDWNVVSCEHLKVDLTGDGGVADVAALASRDVCVSAKHGARAVVQPRGRLEMTCESQSVVECLGGLPPSVDPSPLHIPAEMLLAMAHEARVWTASEPVPDAPTPQSLFDAPRVLHVKSAGFRETLRPLWTAMHSQTASSRPSSPAQEPAWVRVMGEVSGAGEAHSPVAAAPAGKPLD